jgi:hypothetical protein
MEYDKKVQTPEQNGDEAREPMVAYGSTRRAVREPWEYPAEDGPAPPRDKHFDPDDEDDYDPPPDGYEYWDEWLLENDPEYAADFERKAEESKADIAAGRTIPHEEVMREFQQRIENGYYYKLSRDRIVGLLKSNRTFKAEFERKAKESNIDIAAWRATPHAESFREFWQKIESEEMWKHTK